MFMILSTSQDVNTDSSVTYTSLFTPQQPSSGDAISDEIREIYQVAGFVIVCGSLSLVGVGTNIVNIVVFIKQGFKDSINISLLGLAIADLACVVTMFWSSVCYNPIFITSDLPFDSMDVMYVTGGYSHVCFNRITSFITAFITLERCLCITFPLKVKTMITPFRTKIINISIFVVVCILFSPFYFVNTLEWQFSYSRNRTILRLAFGRNRQNVETIIFPIHSVGMNTLSLLLVIGCTIILIVKLNKKTKWRQSSVAKTVSNSESASTKERKVVKMVAFISTIFIICFTPGTIIFFIMAYDPQFNFDGRYKNTFFLVWATTFILETFSSSANMFAYLKMSSKYKITFIATFCACIRDN